MARISETYEMAIRMIDEANSRDPRTEHVEEKEVPKELLYSRRMTERLARFEPSASEPLYLAARCQHIERWTLPRKEFPMDREGYIAWRNELKKYHTRRAGEILVEAGYDTETIAKVKKLIMKTGLKRDPDVQLLEDVVCLVFLEHYFADFAADHEDGKVTRILRKTLKKMSEQGRAEALKLDFSGREKRLLEMSVSSR